jgi:hypothetical protein
MALATHEKVKDKWKWSSLIHEPLKGKIEMWEKSGQGDGGHGGHATFDDEEVDFRYHVIPYLSPKSKSSLQAVFGLTIPQRSCHFL